MQVFSENIKHYILEPDKHELITTIRINVPEYENHYTVRTGVIGDGSCLFHALLYILDDSYKNLDFSKRLEYVSKFRYKFHKDLTIELWQSCSDGLIAQVEWFDVLSQKIIYLISEKKFITITNKMTTKPFTTEFDIKLAKKFHKHNSAISFEDYLNIIQESKLTAFERYRNSILIKWGNTDDIEILEKFLHMNIWICDSDGYLMDKLYDTKKSNILLYNQGDNHWEPISFMKNNKKQNFVFKTFNYFKR